MRQFVFCNILQLNSTYQSPFYYHATPDPQWVPTQTYSYDLGPHFRNFV